MTLSAPSTKLSGADTPFPLWVVILNWNLADDTITCVRSVLAAAPPQDAVHILVVDNGSSDDSVLRVRAALEGHEPGPQLSLVETGANLGFARGVNVGIRHALAQGAQSVLLLNNDTVIDPAMLGHLTAALAAAPEVGLAGPLIFYHDPPTRIWRFGDNEHPWLPIPRRIPDAVALRQRAPQAVDYITGCAMLVRRAVFEQIGLLDERFYMYSEDSDFCRRARDAGFAILAVPQARMWHKVSTSAKKVPATTYYARTWARVRFYRLHPHGKLPWLVHPYLWGRTVVSTMRHLARGEFDLLAPLWRGTRDGYRE